MVRELATIKVSGSSNPKAVAGNLSFYLKGGAENAPMDVEMLSIGAAATNQLVKAIAISSGHLALTGQTIFTRIGFTSTKIEGEDRTVMRFIVTVQ